MADFGTAVRNLRPGYIAKTATMRGYLRRHEIGSRSADPEDSGSYLYYRYSDGRRNLLSSSTTPTAASVAAALVPPETGAASADVVFDLEFVENAGWSDSDSDSRRVYVFRCYQTGGTETSTGTSGTWRVALVSDTSGDASPSTVTPKERYDAGNSGEDRYSQLKLDADTFEMLVSQDWEYNQVTEASYVASTTSQARW